MSRITGRTIAADDAGDVFQEVWLELHRSIPRIRNPQGLPRWLMVATRRLSYKVATRRRRMISGISRDLVDPTELPDDLVDGAKTRQRLEDYFLPHNEQLYKTLGRRFRWDCEPQMRSGVVAA